MKQQTIAVVGGLVIGAVVLGAVASDSFDYISGMGRPGSNAMMGGISAGTLSPGAAMGGTRSSEIWNNIYPSGMMGSAPTGKTLTLSQAQNHVTQYVAQYGQTSLAIDEVMEFQNNFYAIVKDKVTGHGAFEVLVNKSTGAVYPEYGPSMMWNNQYGMMHGMMGYQQSSQPMTVALAQAARIATQWLQQNQPGASTEKPEQFPGYYTVHIRKNGMVTGMLSVNGFTGQVWNHTWHGALIQMKDLHA